MENIGSLDKLKALLEPCRNVVLVGHVNPDGDSIGSLVGMKGYMEVTGRRATGVVPNKYPEFLSFLDPEAAILSYADSPELVKEALAEADLIICMDFNSLKRIDSLGEVIAASELPKVLIDHHPQPDGIFDLVYSYPKYSSTCELAYWIIRNLLQESGKELPLLPATALYTGMMTDTNNFANSVLPSTFRMAGELMDAGVDKEWVQKMVFGGYSEGRMRLMGYMLQENMVMFPQFDAAVMVLTKEIKEKFGFSDGDSEGFVNLALNIRKVKVSALFTEGDEFIRVSLRSKDDFSVNQLSRGYFNGGGHERAAGGRLFIPIGEVVEYFVKSMEEFTGEKK